MSDDGGNALPRHMARLRHAMTRRDIGGVAVRVYGVLFCYANNVSGECWPSVPRLAAELGRDERSVGRALRELADANLIQTVEEGGGRRRTTLRRLTDPPPPDETPAHSTGVSARTNPGEKAHRNPGQNLPKTPAILTGGTLKNCEANSKQQNGADVNRRGGGDGKPRKAGWRAAAADADAGENPMPESAARLDAAGVTNPVRRELLAVLAKGAVDAAGSDAPAGLLDIYAAAGIEAVARTIRAGKPAGVLVAQLRANGAAEAGKAARRHRAEQAEAERRERERAESAERLKQRAVTAVAAERERADADAAFPAALARLKRRVDAGKCEGFATLVGRRLNAIGVSGAAELVMPANQIDALAVAEWRADAAGRVANARRALARKRHDRAERRRDAVAAAARAEADRERAAFRDSLTPAQRAELERQYAEQWPRGYETFRKYPAHMTSVLFEAVQSGRLTLPAGEVAEAAERGGQ